MNRARETTSLTLFSVPSVPRFKLFKILQYSFPDIRNVVATFDCLRVLLNLSSKPAIYCVAYTYSQLQSICQSVQEELTCWISDDWLKFMPLCALLTGADEVNNPLDKKILNGANNCNFYCLSVNAQRSIIAVHTANIKCEEIFKIPARSPDKESKATTL